MSNTAIGTVKTVACKFVGSTNLYTYKVPSWCVVAPQFIGIVETTSGYKTVIVVQVHSTPQIDPNASYEYKWLVDVIDPSKYLALRRAEVAADVANTRTNDWV